MAETKTAIEQRLPENRPRQICVAAIWECWQNQVWSTAMITQAASESFEEIRDRMPLSLNTEQVTRWINPNEDVKSLLQDLRGQSTELQWLPVDPRVNNARNKEGIIFLWGGVSFLSLLVYRSLSSELSISSRIIFMLAGATKPSLA